MAEDFEIDESDEVWFAKSLSPEFEDSSCVLLERKPELVDFFDESTVGRFPDDEGLFANELELEELFLDELCINSLLEDELLSEEFNTDSLFEDKDEDEDKLFSDEIFFNSLFEDEEDFNSLLEDLDELSEWELEVEFCSEFLLLDVEGLVDDEPEFIKFELLDVEEWADDEEGFLEFKLLEAAFSLIVLFKEVEAILLFELSYISMHFVLSELNLKLSSHSSQISGKVHFLQKSIELHLNSSWLNINTNCINNNKKNILFVWIKKIFIFI